MKTLFALKNLSLLSLLGIAVVLTGCGAAIDTKTPDVKTTSATEVKTDARGTKIGQLAPDFALDKTDGARLDSKELNGNPAVLVFWTAWCPTCKEEAPEINKLAAAFEAKGVKVVGINIGESDARVADGIKDFGIKYTVVKDKDSAVSKNFQVVGTPTVVFLDKKGAVRYFGNELPKDYAERLDSILGS